MAESVNDPAGFDNRALQKSALIVATVTSFMGPFLISAVNVALPAVQKEFEANAVLLSWVATSYLLAIAVLLIPIGKIADIYGRNKVFTWGLCVYTLAAFFSAFAASIHVLIVLRVFQGFGAAMFVTTGMAILTSVFPPRERGRVIGIYVAAVYIGLSVGPFVGGLLTQHFGWRSIFWLTAPIGAVSIYITLKYLRGEWADAREERLDVLGSLLFGISISALVYGASLLPSAPAVAWLVVGAVGLLIFIRRQMRIRYPVFDIALFTRNKLFAFSSLAALINYSATFAVTFLLSLYLQYLKEMTPQMAGTVLVAQPIVMAVLSPLAGKLSDKIEPQRIASSGMILTALGLLMLVFIDAGTPTLRILIYLAVLGCGFALFSSPNMSAIMGAVEKRYYGIASGAVATMRLLGQMFSMAIVTVIFAVYIGRTRIQPENYTLFLNGMKICFAIFCVLCAVGVLFSLFRGKMRG
jgi:EmrB/QacA subfamily drug resistance transporter